jgi:hypothetical protein
MHGYVVVCVFAMSACGHAEDPCVSGLQPGQRPGPYSFHVASGDRRGQQHCYVCETGDRPSVIVFARRPSAPLAKLLGQVNQAIVDHKQVELRGWTTFLSDNQPMLEPKLVAWSRENGLSHLPLGVFEDIDGPPSYRLNRDADVTILLSVSQKVVVNFAYRADELNDERIKQIMESLPRIVKK